MTSAKGLKSQLHILLYFGGPFLAVFLSLSSSVKIVVKNIPENIFLPLWIGPHQHLSTEPQPSVSSQRIHFEIWRNKLLHKKK